MKDTQQTPNRKKRFIAMGVGVAVLLSLTALSIWAGFGIERRLQHTGVTGQVRVGHCDEQTGLLDRYSDRTLCYGTWQGGGDYQIDRAVVEVAAMYRSGERIPGVTVPRQLTDALNRGQFDQGREYRAISAEERRSLLHTLPSVLVMFVTFQVWVAVGIWAIIRLVKHRRRAKQATQAA